MERIKGLKEGGYKLKWLRGTKGVGTKVKKVKATECKEPGGAPFPESLSLTSTLYRDEKTNVYDEKDSKLILVQVKKNGEEQVEKTVGKAHLDLAKYIGIPSLTTDIDLEMNKTIIVAKIRLTCTFLKASKNTGAPSSDAGTYQDRWSAHSVFSRSTHQHILSRFPL